MAETILITGSSRGIGRATAELAYKRGYKVILHGRSDTTELQEMHQQLEGSEKVFFDLEDKAATMNAMNELLNRVGVINILINNAGVDLNSVSDISEIDDEAALTEYKINVLGQIHCIQAVLPKMLEAGKGNIINVASIKAYPDMATMSSLTYGASKSGVFSITNSLAKTYSGHGIRVNAIAPGYVETDMAEKWTDDTRERINNGILLGRTAKPEEIAKVIMFLASDDSEYMTGSEVLVDGGYMLKGK